MNWMMLILLALAAARATYLVTDDRLPFGYVRDWLVRGPNRKPAHKWSRLDVVRVWLNDGMQCTHCVSIHAGFWAAVLATYADWVTVDSWSDWPTFAVVWFAISAVVVLLELVHFSLLGDD